MNIESLRHFLTERQDRHFHVFEIGDSPYDSPIAGAPLHFGSGNQQVHVLDSFGGRRPVVLNYDTLLARDVQIPMAVSYVMDARLTQDLHTYRVARQTMNVERRDAVESFLTYLVTTGFDYNPIYYITETLLIQGRDKFVEEAAPVLASILHLHSMDGSHYLRTKQIRPDPQQAQHYLNLYRQQTLDACGWALAESFKDHAQIWESLPVVRASYTCLAQMILIRHSSSATLEAMQEQFEQFVTQEMGNSLPWESQFAMHYFAGLADRYLSVRPGMDLAGAKGHLWSAAWNLLRLRQGERALNPRNLPTLNIAYLCTTDPMLAELDQMFTVTRITRRSDNGETVGPQLGMDVPLLQTKMSIDRLQTLVSLIDRHIRDRGARNMTTLPSDAQLQQLAAKLESRLTTFCPHGKQGVH